MKGLRIAILVDNGFEQVEMTKPKKALEDAGAETRIVSPQHDQVRSWESTEWGSSYPVEEPLDRAQASSIRCAATSWGRDGIPITCAGNPKAVAFVKAFFNAGNPVAAICHGPWTIIETGAARGRKISSWPSLKTDLRNAGAEWVDAEVVVDGNLVSSRKPDDILAFNREMIKLFGQKRDKAQAAGKSA